MTIYKKGLKGKKFLYLSTNEWIYNLKVSEPHIQNQIKVKHLLEMLWFIVLLPRDKS